MAQDDAVESPSFHVLGPLHVVLRGRTVPIRAPRERSLLALLLLGPGQTTSAERLIDQLWQGEPPPRAAVTLRSYISHLRHALKVEGRDSVLVTRGHGYAIEPAPDDLDAVRFERLIQQGRARLRDNEPEPALTAFEEALRLWRGDPFPDITDQHVAQGTIASLVELYLGAQESAVDAMLALGRHLDALPRLEAFVSGNPLREHARGQLMLALYRAGRAPDALDVHRRFRELLADQLGLDPSPALNALRQQILQQSPELDAPQPPKPPAAPARQADVGRRSTDPQPMPGAWTSTRSVETNVVGRTVELRALDAHVERLASGGPGGLLLVAGEAGIGKTTLLEQLRGLAQGRGVPVHWGRSPAASGAPAFWPWTQVITSLASSMDDEQLARSARGSALPVTQLVGSIAVRLDRREEVSGEDPHAVRFLLYEAITVFLEQASQETPMVLVIDDLHWADVPSLELLAYVAPRLATTRTLLASAYRDVMSERSAELDATLATVFREDAVEELRLRGLPHRDVAGLAQQLSGGAVTEEFVTLLHERTAGNPFFVRQLARLILETGEPGTSHTETVAALSPGIRHVLNSRTRGLPPDARRLLDVAAVIGREFELSVVVRAAEIDITAALDALDAAVRHGLVEAGTSPLTSFRFVHGLVQETIYDSLAPGRALQLHARVASALEDADAPTDQVAEHMWHAAELISDERPLRHTLRAAEQALDLLAYEQAELYFRRALQLVRTAPPAPDVQSELGLLLNLFRLKTTNRGWAASDTQEVIQRAQDLVVADGGLQTELLHLWFSLWMSLNSRVDYESADAVAVSLMQRAEETADPAARVAGHLMMAFRDFRRPVGWREGVDHLRAAHSWLEVTPMGELAAFSEHLGVLVLLTEAQTAAFLGEPGGSSLRDEAAAIADADGRAFTRAMTHTIAAMCSGHLADPQGAAYHSRVAREVSEEFGFSFFSQVVVNSQAWAAAHQGAEPADQAGVMQATIELFREAGDFGSAMHASVLLADVLVLTGDVEEARRLLLRVRQAPGPYGCVMTHHIDAKLARLADRVE